MKWMLVAALLSMPIGLCEDYPEETSTPAHVRRDFELLRRHGVRSMRISIGWDGVEAEEGRRDWRFFDAVIPLAARHGITLLPYVCYTPAWNTDGGGAHRPPKDVHAFRRFVRDAVARYRRWIRTWEIWNEPDNRHYWTGTVEEFADLLAAGSAGVREADPTAKVVLGGIAWDVSFLEKLFARHRAASLVDVVNLHAYFETWSPDPLETLRTYVQDASDVLARHGGRQELWMAEVGYSSYRKGAHVSDQYTATYAYEHTPAFQAVALVRSMALMMSTGKLSRIAWYELRDLPAAGEVIGDVNNRHLGVFTPEGEPKPALAALKLCVELFGRGPRCVDGQVDVVRPPDSASEVHVFRDHDGGTVAVAWLRTVDPGRRRRSPGGQVVDSRREKIDLVLPYAAGPDGRILDATGRQVGRPRISIMTGRTAIRGLELRGGEVAVVVLR